MPVRHRRLLDRAPLRPRDAAALAPRPGSRSAAPRRSRARGRTCPCARRGICSWIFAVPMFDDFWITCATVSRPVRMRVADRPAADRHGAWPVWIVVVGLHDACVERRGDRERLHRRARLEEIGDGAVARLPAGDVRAVVGVVVGLVHECQHLTRLRVEDHERAALARSGLDRGLELAVGEELQALVDRERDFLGRRAARAAPRRPRRCARAVLDHLAAAAARPRGARRPRARCPPGRCPPCPVKPTTAPSLRPPGSSGGTRAAGRRPGRAAPITFAAWSGEIWRLRIDELAILSGEFSGGSRRAPCRAPWRASAAAGPRPPRESSGVAQIDSTGGGDRERLAVAILHRPREAGRSITRA